MEKTYKKGDRVTLKDRSSTRMATVVADGMDSQKRVRVRPDNFPMDMSVTTMQSGNMYVIEKMAKGSTVKGIGSYKNHKIGDSVEVWKIGGKTKLGTIIGFEKDGTYIISYKDGSKSYTPKKYIANLSGEFPLMAKGSTVSNKMLEVGDMVKIMPSYPSQYTNSKGQIVKVMPNGKTYEVKIKHKSGNEYVKFEKSELVFLGYEPKYGNGGGVAVSSESGLAVGTNAELLMNEQYLQYADGGGVGEKKYLFESYYVTVNEDNFEEGESLEVFSQYEEKVGKVYNSMENLLRDMNRIMGTDYSKDDFDFETGEGRSIITDVLVDEDFIPPYANEVEKWRKGELKLYNAHYKFYVMPIYVADQYANGGNMSMGFNYSIGGL